MQKRARATTVVKVRGKARVEERQGKKGAMAKARAEEGHQK